MACNKMSRLKYCLVIFLTDVNTFQVDQIMWSHDTANINCSMISFDIFIFTMRTCHKVRHSLLRVQYFGIYIHQNTG